MRIYLKPEEVVREISVVNDRRVEALQKIEENVLKSFTKL